MPGSDLLNSTSPVALNTYTPQNFMDVKKHEMFGPRISRREQRKFNKYILSLQGMQDAIAFDKAERLKAQAASDYATSRNAPILKATMPPIVSDEQKQETLSAISQPTKAPISEPEPAPKPKPVNTAYWNSQANKFGFNNMDEVKAWQQQNGLVADGMFGRNSEAKWRSMQAANPKLVSRQVTNAFDENPISLISRSPVPRSASVSSTSVSPKSPTNTATLEQFKSHENFRPHLAGKHSVEIDGIKYPVMVTTGLSDGQYGLLEDESYAFDEKTGKVRRLAENGLGQVYNMWAEGDDWVDFFNNPEQIWLRANPKPTRETHPGNSYASAYTNWFNSYQNAKNTGFKKQGGIMNRINYFQQGGAAPQQDIKTQVTALVQAAMQGDQKATQQVNQIMEAAKAGDQQAMQIAQIMEQVVKELQGQATAAKWGAKLGYIRSLKYAKGGKTCPVCEKKVEMKACGGKKAKKRYFGGLV